MLESKIHSLTLEQKIGQMLIIRFFGTKVTDELVNLMKNYMIGGIILYYRNYSNYQEMLDLINEIKEINKKYNDIPIFITIDQEGGRVNRFPDDVKNIKSPGKIVRKNDEKLVIEAANITSEILAKTGFNMNFAPSLDIQRFEDNHAIGDRCFGKNKDDVIKNAIPYMRILQENNVISVVKHFPGHGTTTKDSHFFLPKVKANFSDLEKDDIVPFKEAISQGADAIMVSHLKVNDIDKRNPLSLSKKAVSILRNQYKFTGLIITDDLRMKAILLRYGYVRGCKKAVMAGNTIVMMGSSYRTVIKAINNIKKTINKGKISIDDINSRVAKILEIKEKYKINDNKNTGIDVDKINTRIAKLNSLIEK